MSQGNRGPVSVKNRIREHTLRTPEQQVYHRLFEKDARYGPSKRRRIDLSWSGELAIRTQDRLPPKAGNKLIRVIENWPDSGRRFEQTINRLDHSKRGFSRLGANPTGIFLCWHGRCLAFLPADSTHVRRSKSVPLPVSFPTGGCGRCSPQPFLSERTRERCRKFSPETVTILGNKTHIGIVVRAERLHPNEGKILYESIP